MNDAMSQVPPSSPVDWGDDPPPQPKRRRQPPSFWSVLRAVVCTFGLLSLAWWGYISWPFPWPGLMLMIAAPLFAALVWFFFRSPRSPIQTDPVGRAIVEIALVIAASGAWLTDNHPLVGLVFFLVAAVSGFVAFRRELADV